jgi:glutamate synthase (NADPH/NADH) small chain
MAKEKTPRQSMPTLDLELRKTTFREVALGYSEEQARLEASRCIQCKKPKCVSGCPVEVRIPEFLAKVAEGKFLEAYDIVKETNSLPPFADVCVLRRSNARGSACWA